MELVSTALADVGLFLNLYDKNVAFTVGRGEGLFSNFYSTLGEQPNPENDLFDRQIFSKITLSNFKNGLNIGRKYQYSR